MKTASLRVCRHGAVTLVGFRLDCLECYSTLLKVLYDLGVLKNFECPGKPAPAVCSFGLTSPVRACRSNFSSTAHASAVLGVVVESIQRLGYRSSGALRSRSRRHSTYCRGRSNGRRRRRRNSPPGTAVGDPMGFAFCCIWGLAGMGAPGAHRRRWCRRCDLPPRLRRCSRPSGCGSKIHASCSHKADRC